MDDQKNEAERAIEEAKDALCDAALLLEAAYAVYEADPCYSNGRNWRCAIDRTVELARKLRIAKEASDG